MKLTDHAVRQACLSPDQSFIVQAPAGSGKTTLLTQRFLSLLKSGVAYTSILAITFTKKAAEEMKGRICEAIENDHALDIKVDPQKLNIMTFDALCQKMCSMSKPNLEIHCQPKILYSQAITQMFQQADDITKTSLKTIILYFKGQTNRLREFFSDMLMIRDQWLIWTVNPTELFTAYGNACQAFLKFHANIYTKIN